MKVVDVSCDRCRREINGRKSDGGTAGFYRMTAEPWRKYARAGEGVLCDACMWADQGYMADYAARAQGPGSEDG